MAEWQTLLNPQRLESVPEANGHDIRTCFQKDFDRIVFCSHFRRMQDKTQVHPFPNSDYVRRRLTHSLEVSSVARTLGMFAGRHIVDNYRDVARSIPDCASTVGQITAAAALVHDIGNPPLGHSGEIAIQKWASEKAGSKLFRDLDKQEESDLKEFEGNAQGFRILTRLANNGVGLDLTVGTLGAFLKYPTASNSVGKISNISAKKHGFAKSEREKFFRAIDILDLKKVTHGCWGRHPLAFLVEAADDICYSIIDLEDAWKIGRISFKEAKKILLKMLTEGTRSAYSPKGYTDKENIGWLRAKAITDIAKSTFDVYQENEKNIRLGLFCEPLLSRSSFSEAIDEAKSVSVERVFKWDRTVKKEVSGVRMMTDLLGLFYDAAATSDQKYSKKILGLIEDYPESGSSYDKLQAVCDYVSGMTDRYLARTHKELFGIS